MRKTKAKAARRETTRTVDHLEHVETIYGFRACVTATEPKEKLGMRYFVTASHVDKPEHGLARCLRIELQTVAETSKLSGSIHIRERDAWTFLRALELCFDEAAKAGVISASRVTSATAI